jgi:hypothetical protein
MSLCTVKKHRYEFTFTCKLAVCDIDALLGNPVVWGNFVFYAQ